MEESELNGIPMGYKFVPSSGELMEYLRLKVIAGDEYPYDKVITERDIYNPEELQGIFDGAKSKQKVYYFFTKLKKKSKRGSNIDRTVGKGTWKGQQKNKNGRQRSFCYENRGSKEHHQWTMIEYYLPPEIYKTDYVLCRITNKKPKDEGNGHHHLGGIDDDAVAAAAQTQQNHHLGMYEGNHRHQQHVDDQLAPSPPPMQQPKPTLTPTLVDNDGGLLLIDEYLENESYNSSSNQIMTHDQQLFIEGNNSHHHLENETEMQWYMNNINFGAEPQDTYAPPAPTPESSLPFGASATGYEDQIVDGNNRRFENQNVNPMVLDTHLLSNEYYYNNQSEMQQCNLQNQSENPMMQMQQQQCNLQNQGMGNIWAASTPAAAAAAESEREYHQQEELSVFEGDEWSQLNQLLAEAQEGNWFADDPILNQQLVY